MLVALIAKDKPGHLETRKANREDHLAYMKETGLARHAGPLLDSDEYVWFACCVRSGHHGPGGRMGKE